MNKLKNTRKGMLILSILLLFLVIGAASAADDKISEDDLSAPTDSVDEVVSADNDEKVSTAEDTLGSSDTDDNLKATNESNLQESEVTGTFKELNMLISQSDKVANLEQNYQNEGINLEITKNDFVINGNGNTIDGLTTGLIIISGDNIKFTNVILKNTRIRMDGVNTTYDNVTFTGSGQVDTPGRTYNVLNCVVDNAVRGGGAIINTYAYFTVYDYALFKNTIFRNTPSSNRNMIYALYATLEMDNCTVENYNSTGGYIWEVDSAEGSFKNCKFKNVVTGSYIIHFNNAVGSIDNCTFENCNSTNAYLFNSNKIGVSINNCLVDNCNSKGDMFYGVSLNNVTVKNSKSSDNIVNLHQRVTKVVNSTFINNTATNSLFSIPTTDCSINNNIVNDNKVKNYVLIVDTKNIMTGSILKNNTMTQNVYYFENDGYTLQINDDVDSTNHYDSFDNGKTFSNTFVPVMSAVADSSNLTQVLALVDYEATIYLKSGTYDGFKDTKAINQRVKLVKQDKNGVVTFKNSNIQAVYGID
ncbi:MAG: hypothetical protein IJI98_05140, partial [Methanosphaera sp.]|nr:hypothetical protein [Methanosphaera sp.]